MLIDNSTVGLLVIIDFITDASINAVFYAIIADMCYILYVSFVYCNLKPNIPKPTKTMKIIHILIVTILFIVLVYMNINAVHVIQSAMI